MENSQPSNPEIWGGLECTINRVGNNFRDQFIYGGHYERFGDIDRIAALGIRSLRYPILWEHHQQKKDQQINWQWTRQQIEKIVEYDIEPIAGLLHHGSGPLFTDLYQDDFPFLFAKYAGKVAKEFPFITYYTPVNEPLTTARFSGLSGLWYPHHKNDYSFLKILINQLKGIVLAMKAIREINPGAKLVQTEDLSKTHSTSPLNYQRDFENHRRWLTYDILLGRLNEGHVMWDYFIDNGISKSDLYFFADNPCIPEIAGFNYYVTSERYLDHDIHLYPYTKHGGNGKHKYVDIEAVRAGCADGVRSLLTEAWTRYNIPLALTEVHLACTREQQLRWLKEIWEETCKASREGINVKAFTAWSLFGAYDWNSLLTKFDNVYESGAFEIYNNKPRKTAVAGLITSIAKDNSLCHPLAEQKGWWHAFTRDKIPGRTEDEGAPLIIIGDTDTIGNAFAQICSDRGIKYHSLKESMFDVTNRDQIIRIIEKWKPWAIINATGCVAAGRYGGESDSYYQVNEHEPGLLAEICADNDVKFITFSSVGIVNLNESRNKSEDEQTILHQNPGALIIRTNNFFSSRPMFITGFINTCLDLLIDDESGIWLVGNETITNGKEMMNEMDDSNGEVQNNFIIKDSGKMTQAVSHSGYSVNRHNEPLTISHRQKAGGKFFYEKIF